MATSFRRLVLGPLAVVGLFGCVDEKIVYRDRDLFEEPLAAAGNFLGYSDETSKLAVCGNCHVEKQGDWIGTAHADAWSVAGDDAACGQCHAVSEAGNAVDVPAGFAATGEERYHDVQCESCHGPGLDHVSNPLESNAPLAALNVCDPNTNNVCPDLVNDNEGCAECHSSSHRPFAEEWDLSRHGSGANRPTYRTRAECAACHNGEGALKAWGVNTEFVEKGLGEGIGVTCAVCHDPHSADNSGQLRFAVGVADVDTNLCMKCHQRRSVPDLGTGGTSTSGPHAPQGPLLLGEVGSVGWTPPNFSYNLDRIRGTHGSDRNTQLCATCHVNSYSVSDSTAGGTITVTGHRFLPIPCVDSNNVPTVGQTCGKTVAERNFGSCTASGCHGDETAALSALTLAQNRIAQRALELKNLLALVPTNQFSSTDTVFTVAEGARFNQQLGEITSSAVHNPFLTEALLLASIDIVETTYNLPSASSDAAEALQALVSRYGN